MPPKKSAHTASTCNLLRPLLADEVILATKTLNFHWNVTGCDFGPLHELFQSQYETLLKFYDDIAERIRALHEPALGSMQEFLKATRLKEATGMLIPPEKMLAQLLADHEAIAHHIHQDIRTCEQTFDDPATANFLAELLIKHEKIAWILRAHLERV